MRKFTLILSVLFIGLTSAKAQTIASFDEFTLATADTYYVNYSAPATDVGVNSGLAHFPCIYDTVWGGIWSTGFAFSNMTDSVTSGYTNSYSAKTAKGYGGSSKYAAVNCIDNITYNPKVRLQLIGAAIGKEVKGFYVTNSTYAYNSMRDGDFVGKKFGDTVNAMGAPVDTNDWFLLTVKGYSGGSLKTDSVNFYLADFRYTNNDSDYIVNTWEWVNLLPLGNVDSLQFELRSSDTGSFGMNTPAYFCIDNFTTQETPVGTAEVKAPAIARVYPNPASDMLYIDIADKTIKQVDVTDVTGTVVRMIAVYSDHIEINTSTLASGSYFLQLRGSNGNATVRFQKQ